MGAPIGNKNAEHGGMWRNAIKRALAKRDESRADGKKALDELAEQLLLACDRGEISALQVLGDRLDGKAPQSLQLQGDADNPLCIIVRGDDANL